LLESFTEGSERKKLQKQIIITSLLSIMPSEKLALPG